MGACGCGDLGASGPVLKLPAPDGGLYIVECYKGCTYCGHQAAICVHHYQAGDDFIEMHDLEHYPDPDWFGYGNEPPKEGEARLFSIPVVSLDDIMGAIKKDESLAAFLPIDEPKHILDTVSDLLEGAWFEFIKMEHDK